MCKIYHHIANGQGICFSRIDDGDDASETARTAFSVPQLFLGFRVY